MERDQGIKSLNHWEVCNCQPEARSFPEESGTGKGENTFYWWVRRGRVEASASTGTREVIQVWNLPEALRISPLWWNVTFAVCTVNWFNPAANTWLKPCSTIHVKGCWSTLPAGLTCPSSEQVYSRAEQMKSLKTSSQSKPAWPPSAEKDVWRVPVRVILFGQGFTSAIT